MQPWRGGVNKCMWCGDDYRVGETSKKMKKENEEEDKIPLLSLSLVMHSHNKIYTVTDSRIEPTRGTIFTPNLSCSRRPFVFILFIFFVSLWLIKQEARERNENGKKFWCTHKNTEHTKSRGARVIFTSL